MDVLDHKCPGCAAVLKFNPTTQNWKCEFCKGEFTLEQLEQYEKNEDKLKDDDSVSYKDENGLKIYICNNCGAKIVLDENTSATSCIYCKNTAIIRDNLVDEFSPSMLIPFKKTKEEAISQFTKVCKNKPFAPKEFSDKKNISEMSGIYIPFWVFDYESSSDVEFVGSIVKSWTSGNYRYTKTDRYKINMSGNMRFNMVPVDGSVRFQDDIMNSIEPFNYKDLTKFNYSYLSGFLAEKYDVSSDDAMGISQNRANNTVVDELKSRVNAGHSYSNITVGNKKLNLNLTNKEYVLLPVWMLNVKYNDKIYTFAMNGQTGKLIGDVPIDKKKRNIYTVCIFAVCFTVLIIINLLVRVIK